MVLCDIDSICNIFYCTVLYYILLCSIILHSVVLYYITLYSIIWSNTVIYSYMHYVTVLYCITLCQSYRITLHYIILRDSELGTCGFAIYTAHWNDVFEYEFLGWQGTQLNGVASAFLAETLGLEASLNFLVDLLHCSR